MITIQIYNWQFRKLRSGELQARDADFPHSEWKERSPAECDMTDGQFGIIADWIVQGHDIFPEEPRRLPRPEPLKEEVVNLGEPL